MVEHFDAIVVGAGTSGTVLTRRLVDAGRKVLLVEAGREDVNPAIHDPSRMGELWHSEDDWDYFTTPQPHAAHRRLHWPRGKVIGGSHSLNAMIWVRGAAQDYDGWAASGPSGWAWADVLPVFKDIENWHAHLPTRAARAGCSTSRTITLFTRSKKQSSRLQPRSALSRTPITTTGASMECRNNRSPCVGARGSTPTAHMFPPSSVRSA